MDRVQIIRRMQEHQGISYQHRGTQWRTLVPVNGWTGIVVERCRAGEGENEVIYVSPAEDETSWATFFWRHQLEAI